MLLTPFHIYHFSKNKKKKNIEAIKRDLAKKREFNTCLPIKLCDCNVSFVCIQFNISIKYPVFEADNKLRSNQNQKKTKITVRFALKTKKKLKQISFKHNSLSLDFGNFWSIKQKSALFLSLSLLSWSKLFFRC